MNIIEKEFVQLAKEHLIVLEDIKMNKKGYYDMNIYGIEKLYKAIKEHKLKLEI